MLTLLFRHVNEWARWISDSIWYYRAEELWSSPKFKCVKVNNFHMDSSHYRGSMACAQRLSSKPCWAEWAWRICNYIFCINPSEWATAKYRLNGPRSIYGTCQATAVASIPLAIVPMILTHLEPPDLMIFTNSEHASCQSIDNGPPSMCHSYPRWRSTRCAAKSVAAWCELCEIDAHTDNTPRCPGSEHKPRGDLNVCFSVWWHWTSHNNFRSHLIRTREFKIKGSIQTYWLRNIARVHGDVHRVRSLRFLLVLHYKVYRYSGRNS